MKGKLTYFSEDPINSYQLDHKKTDCDRCLKEIKGKKFKVPFLYLDLNDHTHFSYLGYKQYYICEECYIKGV